MGRTKNKRLKRRAIATAIASVAAVTVFSLWQNNPKQSPEKEQTKSSQTTVKKPTDTGSSDNNNIDNKTKTTHNSDTSSETPTKSASGKTVVTPTISSFNKEGSSYVLRGYLGSIFEDGGTCTATLTKSGQSTITKTSKGMSNVSYTICSPISIPASSIPATGEWSLKLTYSSRTYEGSTSNKVNIE